MSNQQNKYHHLSNVHPEAKIHPTAVIEAFATIYQNVEIGENSWIGPGAVIMDGAVIGKNVKIFPGAVISAVPQDLKFEGENTFTEIGDNTVIRECVTINRATKDRWRTVIGRDCLLMAYVHVAHDCIIGDNCILANGVQMAGHVQMGDWAIMGGTSAVHQFCRVGAHSMTSGGSLVQKDIPPYTKAGREPIAYCGINSVGLHRRGFSNEKVHEIQEIYRHIYLKGMNTTKALDHIELNFPPTKERDEILNFIRNSERGIMKGYRD
jgi:UDP-N-acetylglucosamine acyltransferase